MLEMYHLVGRRHSGRAVKVKSLDDTDVLKNLTAAAKMLGPDGIFTELKKLEWRTGIQSFVVGISEPCKPEDLATVKWKKVTPLDFAEGLVKWFTAKDVQVLEALYREYHELTKEELDNITGKALPVSED